MQARSLVNKFAATLAERKAKTIDGTVLDMEATAVVDRRADTVPDVRVRIMATYYAVAHIRRYRAREI